MNDDDELKREINDCLDFIINNNNPNVNAEVEVRIGLIEGGRFVSGIKREEYYPILYFLKNTKY